MSNLPQGRKPITIEGRRELPHPSALSTTAQPSRQPSNCDRSGVAEKARQPGQVNRFVISWFLIICFDANGSM
jgi:hypothetical protein